MDIEKSLPQMNITATVHSFHESKNRFHSDSFCTRKTITDTDNFLTMNEIIFQEQRLQFVKVHHYHPLSSLVTLSQLTR